LVKLGGKRDTEAMKLGAAAILTLRKRDQAQARYAAAATKRTVD